VAPSQTRDSVDLDLTVTALGMATSLAVGCVPACAAARAGIARLTSANIDPDVDEDLDPTTVSRHTMGDMTEGFTGRARLLRLAIPALHDLLSFCSTRGVTIPPRTGLIVNLPSSYYKQQQEYAASDDDEVPVPAGDGNNDSVTTGFIADLLALAEVDLNPPFARILELDQSGAAAVLQAASELLAAGDLDACIVGGIDSLVDEPILDACLDLGILKSSAHAVGLTPGEGAAFILVEGRQSAVGRGAPALAALGASAVAVDGKHRLAGTPPDGKVLSTLIEKALGHHGRKTPLGDVTFYGDLNGDDFRATDWGHAVARLRLRGIAPADEVYLAVNFGDVGAAYGFFAVCIATRSFARDYARSNICLIWAGGDSGQKGAFVVSRPSERGRTP